MNKIDTSNWKTFKLGRIGNNGTTGTGLFLIVNSSAYHGKDIQELNNDNEDGLNYVTRSKFNNGIKCKVSFNESYNINPGGTISFGAENADFFYQKEPYITGNKMYYIDTREISEYACKFLKGVLEATFTANYSFSDGMIPTRIYDENIVLPATSDGEPDWEYMDSYMRAIEQKVNDKLAKLYNIVGTPPILMKTAEWGEFNVSDLFTVQKGTTILSNYNLCDDGKVPVYSSTTDNNGIVGYTNIKPTYIVSNDVPFYIIFGDHTKSMFIAKNDFNIMDNVKVLRPSVYNEYAIRFITTAWSASIPNIGYARHWPLAKKTPILLPEKNGQPDWQYMEEYMRAIETIVEQKMRLLA